MFSGLRSRWIRPRRWAAETAEQTSPSIGSARTGVEVTVHFEDAAQGGAGEQLHDHERLNLVDAAVVVDHHHMRMSAQSGSELGFLHEPLQGAVAGRQMFADDLGRDVLLERDIARLVHRPHTAFSKTPVQTVTPAKRSGQRARGESPIVIPADTGAAIEARPALRAFLEPWGLRARG